MKIIFFALILSPLTAYGQAMLTFDAYARSEVPNDEMLVNLAVERKGPDINVLNESVITAMKSIVAEAKTVSGVNSRLGYISTNPNHVNNVQDGWVVRGDIVLDSMDMKALGQLTGKLGQEYQISGVSFRLSENARKKQESILLPQAAANFKQKASETTNAFGFKEYQIKQITLNRPGEYRPVMTTHGVLSSTSNSAIPAAKGNTEVIVSVTGVAAMK